MEAFRGHVAKRIFGVILVLSAGFLGAALLGLSVGSTGTDFRVVLRSVAGMSSPNATLQTIIWELRWPRVLLAGEVGSALAVGGLVFQALLRNPLADPYVLGISGGAAVGAILGILAGLSQFPGVSAAAFLGSMGALLVVLSMVSGKGILRRDALLLSGVMVNAFCSAAILFFVSKTQDSRLHDILFWLMGDLARGDLAHAGRLAIILAPCLLAVFALSRPMNLLLMGTEAAEGLGVDVRRVSAWLLGVTAVMVSAAVCRSGLLGFVGLTVPHLLRLVLGSDHRVLVPACALGGGAYLVACDALARWIPEQGEMPVGVVTALIGAPLFIMLLRRTIR
jgi:iron complex transport system permease protein